ncbi:hypothetical protein E2562_023982 [Oryza meyeriana var. granulata]|uniref:Uncharacterized protein n=1 Tax=Oryza meyeriana var. granulata TaxID=110450 RepID=A0A6G1EC79_9ORYZ|nr:hypothetical protein E2562_023982 [Oryza meyeriana var. granulata]
MATSFDRWEKDPFFPAAEEVQESADRMESVYRIWVQPCRTGAGAIRRRLLPWAEEGFPPASYAAGCTLRSGPPSGR